MEIHFQFQHIFRVASVHISQILRQDLIEKESAQGRLYIAGHNFSVSGLFGHSHRNPGVQCTNLIFIGENRLVHILKELAFAQSTGSFLCQVVDSQHHILRGHRHRAAVRRLQEVVRGKQKESALRLRLYGKGQMYCHLVTVKVGVKCRTYQGMQLNSLTFHENRLKSLDAQSVQSRSTV